LLPVGSGKSDAKYAQDGAPGFMAMGAGHRDRDWPLMARGTASNGKPLASAFVATYVCQRLPEGWRIAYGHESWAKSFH